VSDAVKQLSITTTPGLRRAIEEHADQAGIPYGALVRQAVMEKLGVDINGQPITPKRGKK